MIALLKSSLASVVVFLVVTGGLTFKTASFKADLSTVDVWAIALLLFILVTAFIGGDHSKPKVFQWFLDFVNRKPMTFLIVLAALLFVAHVCRHLSLQTNAFDVAFVHQPLFFPFAGDFGLHCDVCLKQTYFGEHLSPSLWIVSLLTALNPNDETVFFIQCVLLVTGVWLFLKRGLVPKAWAGLFVLLVLASRAYRNAFVWDFREDHLAFFFLAASLTALTRKNVLAYVGCLCLAILSKENAAFITAAMSVPIFFSQDFGLNKKTRQRLALITLVLSLTWAWVAFGIAIPFFNSGIETQNNIVIRFPGLGSTPKEVLLNVLTSPSAWWMLLSTKLLTITAFKYLVFLLLPFAYFLIRNPLWTIPVFPTLAMNLLSGAETQRSLEFHYDLMALPFLFFVMALELSRWPSRKVIYGIDARVILVLVALSVSGRWPGQEIKRYWPKSDSISQALFLRKLPHDPDVLLAARNEPLAQLSSVRKLAPLAVPAQPPSGRAHDWEDFWNENRKQTRSAVSTHLAYNARALVLDLQEPWQYRIAELAHTNDWLTLSRDPTGRFVYLRRTR